MLYLSRIPNVVAQRTAFPSPNPTKVLLLNNTRYNIYTYDNKNKPKTNNIYKKKTKVTFITISNMTSFAVGEPVSMPKPSMRRQKTPNNSNTSFSLSTSDSILNGSFEKEALGNSMTETEGILKSYDPSFDGQDDVSNFVNSIFNDDKAQANLPHGRSFTSFGSSMELKEPFEISAQDNDYEECKSSTTIMNEEKQNRRYDSGTALNRSMSNNSITSIDIDIEDIAELLSSSGNNYANIMEDSIDDNMAMVQDEEEKEEMKRHSAIVLKPSQTANLSHKAFGQNVAFSKPIFDSSNGLMIVGTQESVKLLSGPKREVDGHKVLVSRLINNTGSSKDNDFGLFKINRQFDTEKYKYSLYASKILPVTDVVHDLAWMTHSKIALATGSSLTLMQISTWLQPGNAPLAQVTTEDLLNIINIDTLHTDDIRALQVHNVDDSYATIVTGGFDGMLKITKCDADGKAIEQMEHNCKKEVIGSIEFHKDWNDVVSFTEDRGILKLFDMRSNKVVMKYESAQAGMYTHAYDIDGNVVCGFEASKTGHCSMEFIDLRKVNSARYKPVCLFQQRDRHMKAIGHICITPHRSMSRIVNFGMPGLSVHDGLVQPEHSQLKHVCYHSPPTKRKKEAIPAQLDGDFIPYSDGQALGVTDHLGNFHIYNLPE